MMLPTGSPAIMMGLISTANNNKMKYTILILSLFFSLSLSGQHMMLAGGVEAATPPANLLLDDYPGAAAAYSLRELSTAWSGQAVVRVRRSSDNTEQDFTAAEVSDGTLATFCGVGDGFVVTWYDQSGNAHDANESTNTKQPQLVSSGSVILENGLPAVNFSFANRTILTSIFSVTYSQPTNYFIVTRKQSHDGYLFDGEGTGRNAQGNGPWIFAGAVLFSAYPTDYLGSQVLFNSLFNGLSSEARINALQTTFGDAGAQGTGGLEIGNGFNDGRPMDGTIQEFIMYDSDQSANRTGIESNINTYYSIY